ncbi:DUF1565 domain-containing protein [Pseudanabaena biceps]|nr:DUF1565 domain-containing protein [Pseudanabaena biceps]
MRCQPSLFGAIATGMTVLAIAPPLFAQPMSNPVGLSDSWKISQQEITNLLPQTAVLIYVAPRENSNGGDGSPNNPYPSITAALATKPVAGTVIQLTQGIYSSATGEIFPLSLPTGVTLRGEPSVRGVNTLIRGSGKFISPSFASQNITILANNDDARIEGITVTNPITRGSAVWVEAGQRVIISNNTFVNSDREGLFLTGKSDVVVNDNVFRKNGANGLSAVGSSTGEIRNNIFENTGFGMAIGQKSQVQVTDNNIINNTDGIIISNLAAPTLRNNLISDNKRNGLVILKDRKGYPTPNLGTSSSLGKNIFRNNLGKDINNNSGVTQVAVGNQLSLDKVAGSIAFQGNTPASPAPELPSQPLRAMAVPPISPAMPTNTIEITRSPQPSFTPPSMPPRALPPSTNSILIEPLPAVPQSMPQSMPQSIIPPEPVVTTIPKTAIASSSNNLLTAPTEVLIDREPIPIIPPKLVSPPRSQPTSIPTSISPKPIPEIPPIPTTAIPNASTVPYNSRVAALVPTPAIDKSPYLVVIPANDQQTLNRVQSAVPTAKIIPSRFGNIIMVQGYPDRDRAEVLKTIMRSEIGLDARVVYQNSL